jgi:hypothetical protein
MDEFTENWIKWLTYFCEIENLMRLKKPTNMKRIFWTLLKGQVSSYFEHHLKRRLEADNSELPEDDLTELVIRELYIGVEHIHKCTILLQKYNMRQARSLYMVFNSSIQLFVENRY